jgi:hypothetical protein
MSLNIPVKLVPDVLGGAGVAEDEGVDPPNTAVNSPTFFFGGSIGPAEYAGMSEASPRNGPWKKLVNSPGFPLFRATGGGNSGAAVLGGAGGAAYGGSFGGAAFALNASHGSAACIPDSPGRLVEGAGRTGGALGVIAGSGTLDFASESKSRNSCVI